jgi:hypothetical protein
MMGRPSGRGYPTWELARDDGSSLALSTDGTRAFLVWTNSLGESFHSAGHDPTDGEPMVFDYFGSWSEAPARTSGNPRRRAALPEEFLRYRSRGHRARAFRARLIQERSVMGVAERLIKTLPWERYALVTQRVDPLAGSFRELLSSASS